MSLVDYRENSRVLWGRNAEGEVDPSRESIQLGCLLRIADGVEAMAKNHQRLIDDNAYLRRRVEELEKRNETRRRAIAAYRGIIKRRKT